MTQSPGHRDHPDHRVREERLSESITVSVNGVVLAQSQAVIKVDEDGHPPRYYFPREDVRLEHLLPSSLTTHCPFKGDATYFSVLSGGRKLEHAAWTYEQPYDEHDALAGRLAFWDEKHPQIEIQPRL